MAKIQRGMVRFGVGGEHPALGLLTPGRVVDVPEGMWSDDLFSPVVEGGGTKQPMPAVDEEVIIGIDDRFQAAQADIQCLEAIQAKASDAEAKAAGLQASLDALRGVSRNLRALQARMAQRKTELLADLDGYRRDLSVLLLTAEQASKALVLAADPEPPSASEAAEPTPGSPVLL